jgi:hypothetical protein
MVVEVSLAGTGLQADIPKMLFDTNLRSNSPDKTSRPPPMGVVS